LCFIAVLLASTYAVVGFGLRGFDHQCLKLVFRGGRISEWSAASSHRPHRTEQTNHA
jgi:hypothetical protein